MPLSKRLKDALQAHTYLQEELRKALTVKQEAQKKYRMVCDAIALKADEIIKEADSCIPLTGIAPRLRTLIEVDGKTYLVDKQPLDTQEDNPSWVREVKIER